MKNPSIVLSATKTTKGMIMFKDIKPLGNNGDWEMELGNVCYVGSFNRDEGYIWSTMKVDGWKTQSEMSVPSNPSKSYKISYV